MRIIALYILLYIILSFVHGAQKASDAVDKAKDHFTNRKEQTQKD